MSQQNDFDYVVIGGGSGGIASARRAAELGARVALIEAGRMGGTCVNVGCVPKKVMYYAAEIAEALDDAGDYGFTIENRGHDWRRLTEKRDAYVERLNGIYEQNLEQSGVTLVRGWARFAGAGEVQVGDRVLTAPHVLIATGGQPRRPDLPGAALGLTSDDVFRLEERPRRLLIVGGGYVGLEFAGIFRGLGSIVTLAFKDERPLRGFDSLVVNLLCEQMTAQGIRLVPNAAITKLERTPNGLHPSLADQSELGEFDAVLWAIGRSARTEDLDLEPLGIETNERGHVPVDAYQNTKAPGVYAIGDVTGEMELTPVAVAAGRMLARRLFGDEPEAKLDYADVPTVVFSHPPVSSVGLTEAGARKLYGDDVRVFVSRFVNMYHAPTRRRPHTAMKLVTVGEEQRVVGVHIVGRGADEILQGFAVAVRMGATKADLDRTVAIHPTAAEELVTMR
ncbi:MAG: glutathione-disulfide reductase [Polyangiaceae bacterium]